MNKNIETANKENDLPGSIEGQQLYALLKHGLKAQSEREGHLGWKVKRDRQPDRTDGTHH